MDPKRAVVTGAASGMGLACVELLLARGHAVLAVDVRAEGLEPLGAAGAQTLAADLSSIEGRAAVIATATAAPVDWLVNAAGIILVRPILEVGVAEYRRVFETNAESTFFLCQGIGGQLREGGAIVNFSSPSAKFPATVETAVYAATKAAIGAMTRSYAVAFAPRRVRVNAISPGITDTPMQEVVLRDVSSLRGVDYQVLSDARMRTVPLGRSAPPAEMAAVVAWLLSDEAAYITGQVINVDGGMVMW
jgi:NAD(P)-dependent dehydrogenase (short-subunit alcohol dehydrogenase family)